MLESVASIQDRWAHRRRCFEEHRARVAIRITGPVGGRVNDAIIFVNKISMTVREDGVGPRLEQTNTHLQKIRQPQIIRTEIGEVVSAGALEAFIQSRAE